MFMVEQFRGTLKSAKVEEPIPEANRVADVLLTFKTGGPVAHEVQLSPITTGELAARTRDYADVGVDVYWWLGKQAATTANRQWCLDEIGKSGASCSASISSMSVSKVGDGDAVPTTPRLVEQQTHRAVLAACRVTGTAC